MQDYGSYRVPAKWKWDAKCESKSGATRIDWRYSASRVFWYCALAFRLGFVAQLLPLGFRHLEIPTANSL